MLERDSHTRLSRSTHRGQRSREYARHLTGVAIIRTVRGDIRPDELGPCDAHEHFFLVTPAQPGDDYADVAKAIEEAETLRAAGARAAVDWTPIGLGRDLDGLQAVADAVDLHIVAATGLHRDPHYAADDPLRREDEEALAARFVADLERCGIIKVGAGYHAVAPFEAKAFAAAAIAHGQAGAPVCVHTEHGTMGLALVERLGRHGVPAERVILAHVDRNPDPAEHAETAATGAWLQLDGPGRTKYWPDSAILGLIADLAGRGYADRLLIGGDTGRRSMLRAFGGGPGMDYVFARFKPRLERELGQALSEQIFVANPARAFAFAPAA
ncbi:MAG: aryldialkylphosphatase [Actinomycetota bacterium]|nr:aryldialkylphosphatase [Actinomycetota bacterium]